MGEQHLDKELSNSHDDFPVANIKDYQIVGHSPQKC